MRGLSLAAIAWCTCLACTAPMPDSLPDSELEALELFRYELQPEAPEPPPEPEPEPEPDLDRPALLAASPTRGVWALSDRRRLWIADARDELAAIPRAEDAPEIVALDVDDEGELWILEAGGRLLSTPSADELPRERGLAPVADAIALEVSSRGIVILGFVEKEAPWPYDHPVDEAPDELFDALGFWPDSGRVLALSRRGRDWLIRPTPRDGNMFDELVVDAEGEILLFDGDELGCGGGAQTLLVDAEGLWSIAGGEVERIGEGAPQLIATSVDASTVDARGRLLALAEGTVHAGSPEGWSATPVW